MNRFDGRTVVVTGGGGGIGAALCRGFATEGARVAVLDRAKGHADGVAEALTADERALSLEQKLFDQIRRQCAAYVTRLQALAAAAAADLLLHRNNLNKCRVNKWPYLF